MLYSSAETTRFDRAKPKSERATRKVRGIVRRESPATWPAVLAWPEERIDKAFRDMFRDFCTGGVVLDRYVEGQTN